MTSFKTFLSIHASVIFISRLSKNKKYRGIFEIKLVKMTNLGNRLVSTRRAYAREKGKDLTQSYDKSPYRKIRKAS